MAINKVIYNSEVLIDVTDCDITEADVAAGKRFIKKNGEKAIGTSTGGGGTSAVLGELNVSSNGTYEAGIALVPGGIYQFKEQLPVETLAELYSATQGNSGVIFSAVIQEVVAAKLAIYKTNDVYILESNSGGGIVENIYSTGTATFKYHSSMDNTDVEVELTPGWNLFAAFGDIHMPGTSLIKLPRDISGIPEGVVNLVDLQFDTNNCVEAVADESSVTITIEGLGQFVKLNNSFDPTKRFAIDSLGGVDEFNPGSDPSGDDVAAIVPVYRNLMLSNLQDDIEGIKYLTLMLFPVFLVYVEDSSKIKVTSGTAESDCWYLIQDATTMPWTFAYNKDPVDGYNKVIVDVPAGGNLQNKVITENGTFTCDDGFDGLRQVTVKVEGRTLLDNGKLAVHTVVGADDLSLDPNKATIEELIVNKGATSVSNGTGYTSLKRVVLPDTLETVGSDAFNGCNKLTSITIPNSVTSIGFEAFYNCSGLTSIVIPNSVTVIGEKAFDSCSGLTSIVIPDSVTSIGIAAFRICRNLTRVDISDLLAWCKIQFENYLSNPLYYAKKLYLNNELVTNLAIPNDVTSIGSNAFYNCSSLTSVTIPDSITNIGNFAFKGCSELTSVTIPDSVTSIGFEVFNDTAYYNNASNWQDDVLYIGKHLITAKSTISGDCVIKNGTLTIADIAFDKCIYLTSITIPDSVTSIGRSAFATCKALTSVVIPDNVTSIGDFVFSDCKKLTSVTIGNGVTSIGGYAFNGCSVLTSIIIPDSVTSIGMSAFYGCSGLTSVTIGNRVTSIGNDTFSGCSGLTSVTIPDSVTSIGSSAFQNCSGLTSVTIPNGVTSIGGYAFYSCSGLTSVTIGNRVTSIGNNAFFGCSGLTSITIMPSTPPTLSTDVFTDTALTQIIVPAGCGEAYRTAANWSNYAEYITEMEEGMHRVTLGEEVTCSVDGTSYSNQTFDVADQTVIHFEVGRPPEGGAATATPDGIFLNGVLVSDNSGPATYDLTVTGNVSVTYSAGDVVGDITYNHCYKIVMD